MAGPMPAAVLPHPAVPKAAVVPAPEGAIRPRVGWVDSARGIGIVLVVAGHALGGLIDSPVGRDAAGFRPLFLAIYTFHMPLFLLLSGLLVPDRLGRGRGPFLRAQLPGVAWPYFLWSIVQFSLIFALGSWVNRPIGAYWPNVLALPWHPVSQFWFLYALFWMHGLAALVLPRGGAGALLALGLAAKLAAATLVMPVPVKLVANHFVWYALGTALAGMAPRRICAVLLGAAAAGGALVAMAVFAPLPGLLWVLAMPPALAASAELAGHAWQMAVMPVALVGVAAVIALAAAPRLAASALLAGLGRRTMAVFVLHVMFVAGARIVLVRLGLVTQPWLLLVLQVPLGLAGPLLVERALRPLGLRRWLGF